MTAIWNYIRSLVGNGKPATIGIFVFIIILCTMFARCARADETPFHAYLQAGSSFGTEGVGPVLGLKFKWDHPTYSFFAGTTLWGAIHGGIETANNWDWHGGVESCRGQFCAAIGTAYVQKLDAVNGAHTNFFLQVSWKPSHEYFRFSQLDVAHISDAGTTPVNIGRQAVLASFRLQ